MLVNKLKKPLGAETTCERTSFRPLFVFGDYGGSWLGRVGCVGRVEGGGSLLKYNICQCSKKKNTMGQK